MKTINQKLLATAVAALFVSPAAFATNGTNMTGVSAQANAMGGTGTAAFYGAENVIINPAMIGKVQNTEFAFGGTLFKPSVSNDGGYAAGGKQSSAADTFMIPTISLASRINSNLTFGVGMYGTSGMGVDYSGYAAGGTTQGLMNAKTTLQIMRVVPTIAYNGTNYGVGFSPIIQYGALDMNFNNPDPAKAGQKVGSGMSSDLGYGFSLGGYYDVTKALTLGATYTSAINMKYKNQLSTATQAFKDANQFSYVMGDNLEQPAEIKVGAAYTMGNIMLTGDLKQIKWSDAKGYKEFGWQDQNVIALGLKYSGTGYWLGAGINKADNPIKANTVSDATKPMDAGSLNYLNNLMFPATTDMHFSVGGGYDLTKSVSIDGAIVYAPETTTSVKVNTATSPYVLNGTDTTSHSQMAYTVSARYKF
jgi:long-chain fatty acid transport protein